MASILGKFVRSGKNKFTTWDSKLNFVIPENIATYYGIHGKKDDRNLILGKDNFRFQIGKMDKNDETIYSKEIILGGLEYLLKKVGNNEKIIIQLRPDLARYLCNEDQKGNLENILTFEQEEKEIQKLIKKYFKYKSENIQITNISDQYPEIFDILKEHGYKGLETKDTAILDSKHFSALSVVQYLYRICRNNKKFMQIFYNTKSSKQKQEDAQAIGENESDYYALVEIAIRLYEVIQGTNIQGGIDRQTKYDRIIGGILYGKDIDNFKIKDYPEILELHKICHEINPNIEFERIYIATKGIREIEDKKIKRKETINKLTLYTALITSLLMGALGGTIATSSYMKHQNEKENKEKETILLANELKAKDLRSGFKFMFDDKKTIESKLQMVESATNNIYYQLLKTYKIKNTSEEEIKALIKNELLKGDNLNDVCVDFDRITEISNDFIINVFIPNNTVVLNQWGCDFFPYNAIKKYQQYFNETEKFQGDVTIDWQIAPMGTGDGSFYINPTNENNIAIQNNHLPKNTKCYFEKVLDEYEDIHGAIYSVMLVSICEQRQNTPHDLINKTPPITKQYIVASPTTGMINKTYSIEVGKRVIQDITSRRSQTEKALQKTN